MRAFGGAVIESVLPVLRASKGRAFLLHLGQREVLSSRIGELVMRELKKLDKVAYVRFASVYRSFEDIDEFRALVDEVRK